MAASASSSQPPARERPLLEESSAQLKESDKHRKVHVFDGCLHCYLNAFVPSETTCPPPKLDRSPASERIQSDDNSPHVIKCLQKLAKALPKPRRLAFLLTEGRCLRPPLPSRGLERFQTSPTIVASLPGKHKSFTSLPEWSNVSCVFDIMPEAKDDPVNKKGLDHEEALVRLSRHAQNLLIAHHLLFAFVVGIFGSSVRIFRFDHTAVAVSRAFDYTRNPEILWEFLWRLCHPAVKGAQISGADPTIKMPKKKDIRWARKMLLEHSNRSLAPEDERVCRWIVVHDDDGRILHKFFAFRIIYLRRSLFSSASTVWEVLKHKDHSGKIYVMKDSWRFTALNSELGHYRTLAGGSEDHTFGNSNSDQGIGAGNSSFFGVAQLVCGIDLGRLTSPHVRGLRILPVCTHITPPKTTSAPSRTGDVTRDGESSVRSHSSSHPLPSPMGHYAGHRTMSVTIIFKSEDLAILAERTHMRFVFATVGRPLSQFRSTRELVAALRDAIKGHKHAYEAGILHRGINEGNVMIAEAGAYEGFISDFNNSFDWISFLKYRNREATVANWEKYARAMYAIENGQYARSDVLIEDLEYDVYGPPLRPREHTRHMPFAAIEIVENISIHEARHDLESFYWLLLWLVLRHTEHKETGGRKDGAWMFEPGRSPVPSDPDMRKGWILRNANVVVPGNQPLTTLLRELQGLCIRNFLSAMHTVIPLTHEVVLAKFDEALARTDWPENDAALPQHVTTYKVAEPGWPRPQSEQPSTRTHRTAQSFPTFNGGGRGRHGRRWSTDGVSTYRDGQRMAGESEAILASRDPSPAVNRPPPAGDERTRPAPAEAEESASAGRPSSKRERSDEEELEDAQPTKRLRMGSPTDSGRPDELVEPASRDTSEPNIDDLITLNKRGIKRSRSSEDNTIAISKRTRVRYTPEVEVGRPTALGDVACADAPPGSGHESSVDSRP